MDYGKTLHLPETEFPMRGNLPKREPEILKFWEDNKIYQKRQRQMCIRDRLATSQVGIHTACQSSMRLLRTLVLTVMKWLHWTCAINVRNMHWSA